MLRLRFLSAFVGVPILLFIAVMGGGLYVAAVVVAAVVGTMEVLSMLAGAGFRPLRLVSIGLAVGIVLDALATDTRIMPAILVLAMLIGLGQMMLRPDADGAMVDWALTLAPAIYVGGTMHYLILLRNLPDGLLWILTVLVCTWVCDIAAFFVGRRWGNARLAPKISPGKSVEGAIGGLVGAVLAAMVLGPFLDDILRAAGLTVVGTFRFPRLAGLGLAIGVCAIVGDLMESFIKRQCGAKDSGNLIPGHGGILDRIDSVLLAVVGAYFYVVTTS
ncbi:MAG: CDP-archaeol synthase [Chloroflexota bacterium]